MNKDLNLGPNDVSAHARPHVEAGPLDSKEYGSWLKSLREEVGLTLAELGELTGYSTSHISQTETGKKKKMPSPEYLEKISRPLNIEYSHLLQLAGYVDLAQGVRTREARQIFADEDFKEHTDHERFIVEIADLKRFLERKVSPYPHYNGHRLTDRDKQRILEMFKVLFPEYQLPPDNTEESRK